MAGIPQNGAPSIRANGRGRGSSDLECRAGTVVNILTHACVDQKEQAEALEHLPRAPNGSVGKANLRRYVSFDDMFDAQRPRVRFQKLLLTALRQSRVDPWLPASAGPVEPRFEQGIIAGYLLRREAMLAESSLQAALELIQT